MHHRDYSAQRHSPLDTINKSNVKNMKLLFAVRARRLAANEALEGTPLVDDGFMYMSDHWGVVYKIDVRDGNVRPDRLEDGPRLRRSSTATAASRCGTTSSFRSRLLSTPRDRDRQGDRQGRLGQEPARQPDMFITAAPLALKDAIIIGGSGGDRGLRNWVAALDPKTGDIHVEDLLDPGARRARQRDLEGQPQRLADRRRRVLRHRLVRSAHQSDLLGLGQSGAGLRSDLSPRRQSLHVERDRLRCRQRQDHVASSTRRTTIATMTRPAPTS